ncbi:MAG: hydrogenase maturation nickel metallochaperone HypA [Gemmatimonadales bacterium]
MHELSLALGIVDAVSAAARRAGAVRVLRIKVRIGVLSGVVADALRFGFDVASRGTVVAEAALDLEVVPVSIWCPACAAEVRPVTELRLQCPDCGLPSGEIRRGRELEVAEMEIDDGVPAGAGTGGPR